jgi:hypothetical protein
VTDWYVFGDLDGGELFHDNVGVEVAPQVLQAVDAD